MSSDEFQKLSLQTGSQNSTSPKGSPGAAGASQTRNPAQNLALGSLNAARGKPASSSNMPAGEPLVSDPAILARIAMVCN